VLAQSVGQEPIALGDREIRGVRDGDNLRIVVQPFWRVYPEMWTA
jgi:hypothetical protein